MAFVGITTAVEGLKNLTNIYIPQILDEKTVVQGTINSLLTGLILICVFMIILDAIPRWVKKGKQV